MKQVDRGPIVVTVEPAAFKAALGDAIGRGASLLGDRLFHEVSWPDRLAGRFAVDALTDIC